MTVTRGPISEEQVRQFHEEGYCVLEGVVPERYVEDLRAECQRFIDARDAEMDRLGVEKLNLDHKGRRYFLRAYHDSQKVREFLHSELMADVVRATLGETAYLFHDQYVVKAAEKGMKFGWHQDSGFTDAAHEPYLSCWITLDDVTEENGTVYILPYSRAGTRGLVEHVLDEATNDRVCYTGDDPGEPVVAPAGSIACFSSVTFHRSGPNTTDKARRVFLAQYSAEPILDAAGNVKYLAEPLLENGRRLDPPAR
jgi:ectoine hydroxylase-related dioxygenase (phytanoyl-CoA dioxygenase family)